jgi:DNA polymerase-3 subunit delta
MVLREARVWGEKESLFERVLPRIDEVTLARLVEAAALCDGLIKGLRHPEWPSEPWDGLRRLVLLMLDAVAPPAKRSGARPAPLALLG